RSQCEAVQGRRDGRAEPAPSIPSHLSLLLLVVQGQRPQTLWRPQAAQRAPAFIRSTPFAAPARTIAQAPPATATQLTAWASVTCAMNRVSPPVARCGIGGVADGLRASADRPALSFALSAAARQRLRRRGESAARTVDGSHHPMKGGHKMSYDSDLAGDVSD